MDATVAPAPVAVVPLRRSALAGALLLRPDECHREEALQERRACHCLREQGAPRQAAGAVLADRSGSVFRVWEQHCTQRARTQRGSERDTAKFTSEQLAVIDRVASQQPEFVVSLLASCERTWASASAHKQIEFAAPGLA